MAPQPLEAIRWSWFTPGDTPCNCKDEAKGVWSSKTLSRHCPFDNHLWMGRGVYIRSYRDETRFCSLLQRGLLSWHITAAHNTTVYTDRSRTQPSAINKWVHEYTHSMAIASFLCCSPRDCLTRNCPSFYFVYCYLCFLDSFSSPDVCNQYSIF